MNKGDRVVCVNAKGFQENGVQLNLIEGREYIVYGLWECSCGISYDVGIIGSSDLYCCMDCKKDTNYCAKKAPLLEGLL